jgi:hypothetical protein
MRFTKVFFFATLILLFTTVGYSETDVQKGTRIAKMYDDMPSFENVRATINLQIYDKDGKIRFFKTMMMASHTENPGSPNKVEKFIAYFTKPADDMGSSLLFINRRGKPGEKYIYLKSIRKVKTITGSDKKLSFFGSDYTNSEVSMPEFLDFTYRYLRDDLAVFKGKEIECYVVECLPRSQQVKNELGYGKKILYFEKKSLINLKAEYYDENMAKWKETKLISFITKNNMRDKRVYYVTCTEMHNVQTGTKSRISFSDFLFEEDAKINQDIFSIEYLTKKWW